MEFKVDPIGYVQSRVITQIDESWGDVESRLVLLSPSRTGLRGLEQFSHVIVVVYLHEAAFDPARHLVRQPRGLAHMPELGIFAQRFKDRPNPLGVTTVRILGVDQESVLVRGLDAIDGTPILDLKPYFPVFDEVQDAQVPGWVDELMQGYF